MNLNPKNKDDIAFMKKTRDPVSKKTLWELHLESLQKDTTRKESSTHQQNHTKEQKLNVMGSRRTQVDGQWFDSGYEGSCWLILKDLQREGLIDELTRDREFTHFEFIYNDVRIAQTKLDFAFTIVETSQRVLADSKSPRTINAQRFVWQCRMMLAWYEIDVMVFLQGTTNIKKEIKKRIREFYEKKCLQPEK